MSEKKEENDWGCFLAFIAIVVICFVIAGERDGYGKTASKAASDLIGAVLGVILAVFLAFRIGKWLNNGKK